MRNHVLTTLGPLYKNYFGSSGSLQRTVFRVKIWRGSLQGAAEAGVETLTNGAWGPNHRNCLGIDCYATEGVALMRHRSIKLGI